MEVNIVFDGSVYSINAIKKAAYRKMQHFGINVAIQDGQVLCSLSFKDSLSKAQIDEYLNDFKREVLDQDLRESIKTETELVRNLILSHTFSKTGLIGDE